MNLSGKFNFKFRSFRLLLQIAAAILTFIYSLPALSQTAEPDTTIRLAAAPDTAVADTQNRNSWADSLGIRISPDALPSKVTATSKDSAVMDADRNVFDLYGDANVKYEDLELNAGHVTYEQSGNMITAEPLTDSAGNALEKPTFKQGTETFVYDRMQYNFVSKRAIVRNARTQYGEGFVFSEQVKRNPDQSIYGYHSVYTTCSLDTPHFGIRAQKIKVIPNRIIASGPANLVIENVPTPLYLPFGLFPIAQGQRSGFRLPSYTIENERGLGLTNGGYYFYLNDYVDLLLLANIYSKGSWSASATSSYSNRYRYNGIFIFNYGFEKTGEVYEPNALNRKSFAIQWQHQTDPKARPGITFNSNVNVVKNNFYSNNSYNPNQILQNQYQSNISFSKTWQDKPFNLTAAFTHSQNTQTRQVNVSLPELSFYVSQVNPFKSKHSTGTRWYEKITSGYTFNFINRTTFSDSGFSLNQLAMEDFQNGMKHTIPISASYNVLRFINFSVGSTYNEYWLTRTDYQYYNTAEGRLDSNTHRGFFAARDFNASVNASTRIYGMKMFKKGKLMGIRHVLTPSVGFTYTPDFAAKPFEYAYLTRLDASGQLQYVSPFVSSIIGAPSGPFGRYSSNLNYSLNNNLQIKTRSRKDTTGTGRNITLIDGFSIGGAYDLAADSFNWSNVGMSFRTNILDKVNVSGSAVFDPYGLDYETGRRNLRTAIDRGAGLARFQSASVSLGASFRSKDRQQGEERLAAKNDDVARLMQFGGYNDYVDFNIPWSINLSYSLNISNNYSRVRKTDTLVLGQFAQFSGDFNLTPRWKVAFSSGYDFTAKQLQFTSIDIYRDLHCWEMHLQTIPFGERKSYNFTLNVKAAVLQDLRLLRRRDYRDAVGF